MLSISFVIPAFNAGEMLSQSVESIFNGNFQNEDEVIIVDDASTDNTHDIALDLQSKHSGKIKIFRHVMNKGSAAASRNTAIENAKNELIFCLDADNYLIPGSIERLKKYLIENKLEAVAFGEIHYFSTATGIVVNKWILNRNFNFIDNINNAEKTPCSSGNYLFYKSVWKKVGRYDESVGGAFDSWAFGAKKLAFNIRFETMPESFYMHRVAYNSTFMREVENINMSLLFLRIVLPYVDLLHPLDYKYITSRWSYKKWMSCIDRLPLNGGSVSPGILINLKKFMIVIFSGFYQLRR